MQKKYTLSLIESLAVISLIVILLLVVLPALYASKANSQKALCMANLSGIGKAFHAYTSDYDGQIHDAPNMGLWEDPDTGIELEPDHGLAYWGVAYSPYLGTKNYFHCPSAKYVDMWYLPAEPFHGRPFEELSPIFAHSHYGLNGYVGGRKIAQFASPDTVIFAQDHAESKLDSFSSDMLCAAPGSSVNLTQWRGITTGNPELYPNSVAECFRHNRSSYGAYDNEKIRKGFCNTVWMDGHVSSIAETWGKDVPTEWYTGEQN